MDMIEYYDYTNQKIEAADTLVITWRQLKANGQALVDKFNADMIAKFEELRKAYPRRVMKRSHYIDLYSICDAEDNIIYTGKARKRVVGRLWDHVGRGQYNKTPKDATTVGKYILANKPASYDWKIILYDLPVNLEVPLIYLTNPFFTDDYKPADPSIMPYPTPAQELIDAMNSKKGHENQWN